ncbi:MAG: radical SAM protein [Solirubrobacteraceae bacterium]
MRWDNLLNDTAEEQQRHLPGYRDPAVVRTFDAPEALGTRFYEVRAKSALNRVPDRSMVPFRWTINPYRGCSHACSYCQLGNTPILMADGRTRPIADVEPGDRIYGTVREGSYRRYVRTEVLDRWVSTKPAYRITLEDGTELISSGDHRYLSDRGWKHVVNNVSKPDRPHLTLSNKLIGTGVFAEPPLHTPDYERGYLCGILRGDGSYHCERARRSHGDFHRLRLPMTDLDALRRARHYLANIDVETDEFTFLAAAGEHRAMRAIRTQAQDRVAAVREAIRWPISPSDEWRKGFLAGIFDAEGSGGPGALRIATGDCEIVDRTTFCLRRFGFNIITEPARQNGVMTVHVRGGLKERLRFFHLTDPAIRRKCDIEGMALKSDAKLRVVSIEPLGGALPLYDITTGTGDFIANGVVSHNCFARPTHTYLDLNAREDFEREIVVKVNVPEVLRAELARASWKGEHIAMGTNTDPYQWVEGRYRLMEGIWEALRDAANPASILTKSPLLLRDTKLLQELGERAEVSAAFSVPTLDEKAWRATEPHTPHPRKRLEAVAELTRAGIPTGVLVAPLIPGVNDDPAQVEEIVELATAAGASHIGGIALHLRGEVRDIWFDWLRAHRPDLVAQYDRLYRRGAYMQAPERERLGEMVSVARERARRKHPDPPQAGPPRFRRGLDADADEPPPKRVPARKPQQGALF